VHDLEREKRIRKRTPRDDLLRRELGRVVGGWKRHQATTTPGTTTRVDTQHTSDLALMLSCVEKRVEMMKMSVDLYH